MSSQSSFGSKIRLHYPKLGHPTSSDQICLWEVVSNLLVTKVDLFEVIFDIYT